MGKWRAVSLLALIVCGAAPNQVEAQMSSKCVGAPHLKQACEAEFIAECVKHWDAGTNMSKETTRGRAGALLVSGSSFSSSRRKIESWAPEQRRGWPTG